MPLCSIAGPELTCSVDAELVRDHVRERGLAEAGRPGEQHVVERLAALLRAAHETLQVLDQLALADVLVEGARAQRGLPRALAGALGRSRPRALVLDRPSHDVDVLSCAMSPRHAPQRLAQQLLDRRVGRHRQIDDRAARPRPAASPC